MPTNLTADAVVATANNLLNLLAVVNPAAAGAAVAVKGTITFLNATIIPEISRLVQGGQISAAEQQKVKDAYTAFRANFPALFQGAEWEIEPDPAPPASGGTPPPATPSGG